VVVTLRKGVEKLVVRVVKHAVRLYRHIVSRWIIMLGKYPLHVHYYAHTHMHTSAHASKHTHTDTHNCYITTQGEAVSFVELSSRASLEGEILVGYVERSTKRSFLNPENKLEARLSRATVEALVTMAWS